MFVAVLALALGGLALDRLVLDSGATGPGEASADESAPLATSPSATAATPAPQPSLTNRADTLAGRLERIAREEHFEPLQVDDAFRASPLWVKPPAKSTEEKVKAPVNDADAFVAKHKLMAVITNSSGGAAIIGSQTVLVGRSVDGFTLVSVTKRSAVLEKGGQRVELALPEPSAGPSRLAD